MLRKATLVVLCTVIAGGLPNVAVAHHTGGAMHYVGDCTTGNPSYNLIDHIYRSGLIAFGGARSRLHVQTLYPCTGTNTTNGTGWSLVNGANLQGGSDVAQVGYSMCNKVSSQSNCGLAFPSGVMEFWFTKNARMDINPATWVDLNNDGITDLPIVGHEYRFSIWLTSSGGSYWHYQIQDLSASGTPYDSYNGSRTDTSESKIWFGYEVWNDASVIGDRSIDPVFSMKEMEYSTSASPTSWSSPAAGDTQCYAAGQPQPSWAVCLLTQDSTYGTVFDAYTVSHN